MIEEIQSLKNIKLKAIERLEQMVNAEILLLPDMQIAQALQDIAIRAEHQIHQINTVVEERRKRENLNARRGY